jgi:hypothetical protein
MQAGRQNGEKREDDEAVHVLQPLRVSVVGGASTSSAEAGASQNRATAILWQAVMRLGTLPCSTRSETSSRTSRVADGFEASWPRC